MSKILLVEDDTNLREIYEARLQAEGYNIVSAKDGEEALVVAKKEHPDLIISDVMMPRISGFEMLDILRNTDELKHVKIIMLTALGQAEDKTRADSLGADRYLVKSQVTLEDIVKAAQELLSGQTDDNVAVAPVTFVASAAPAPEPTPVTAAPAAPTPVVAPQAPVAMPIPTPVPAPAAPVAMTAPAATPMAPIPSAPAPQPSPVPTASAAPIATPAPSVIPAPVTQTTVAPAPQPIAPAPVSAAPAQPATPIATPPVTAQTVAPAPATPPPAVAPTPEPTPVPVAPTPQSPAVPAPAPIPDPAKAEPTSDAQFPGVNDNVTPQTTSDEEAVMKTQIDNFVKDKEPAPAAPTPATTPPITGSGDTDTLVADAIKNLVADATPAPSPASESTPVAAPAVQPFVQPTPVAPEPTPVTPAPTIETPAPTVGAPALGASDNDAVTIAHKKIIRPIDEEVSAPPDLNALLAKEGIENLDDEGHPFLSNTAQLVNADGTQVPPHPPGHVIAPTNPDASGTNA